jgi:hypothetical protein
MPRASVVDTAQEDVPAAADAAAAATRAQQAARASRIRISEA